MAEGHDQSLRMGIGIVGTGWVADVHARAIAQGRNARLVAVASRDRKRAERFARTHGAERAYGSVEELLADQDVEAVVVALPNSLHHPVTLQAAEAGKHVLCEKPLAVNRRQGREMIEACRRAGVTLGVAEELCFVPKFVRAKQLVEAGALGKVFQVRQREEHDGPGTAWFFDRELAGGGALLDMGCHSIELARWILGRPRVKEVFAHMANRLHPQTELEDEVTMVLIFEDGATATLHSGWSLRGGMDSQLDVMGTEGVLHVDLLKENGIRLFSNKGGLVAGEAVPPGWSTPDPDWLWNNGYAQQMDAFVESVRRGEPPRVTGEHGLEQLEIMCAAYHSAASGKSVRLDQEIPAHDFAVDAWLQGRGAAS